MLSSMTGFATKIISLPLPNKEQVNLTINLKTLNSRFFEATCRLSHALSSLETELIKRAKKELHRGQMYLNMNLSNPNCFKSEVVASSSVIKGYLNAFDEAQKNFNIPGKITISDLIILPNIFVAEDEPVNDQLKKLIIKAFTEVLNKLNNMRSIEGKELLVDLQKRTVILSREIDLIKERFKEVFKYKKEDVKKELDALKKNDDLRQQKQITLQQELDRMDIHEEIVRFKTHLKSFIALLKNAQKEKGRQLDFILQELGREINTIAAKCTDSTISSHAITTKVELEKCREQIQNVV